MTTTLVFASVDCSLVVSSRRVWVCARVFIVYSDSDRLTIITILHHITELLHRQPLYWCLVIQHVHILGNFTFWRSLSLSPKFGLSPKLSQEMKSIFSFGPSLHFGERLSESLSLKFGLSPKLIWTIRTRSKWTYMQEIP